jgi:hypothetical protein
VQVLNQRLNRRVVVVLNLNKNETTHQETSSPVAVSYTSE